MRNLILESSFVCFRIMHPNSVTWFDFKFGAFEVYFTWYVKRRTMGWCRFYLDYKAKTIFHWCDLCVVPRIKGVNL